MLLKDGSWGHIGKLTSLALLAQVTEVVNIPVIKRRFETVVLAVLMPGADGIQVGTVSLLQKNQMHMITLRMQFLQVT